MSQIWSDDPPTLPLVACLLSALAGAALMFATPFLLYLPLRISLLVAEAALLVPAFLLLVAYGVSLRRGLGLVRIRMKTALLSAGAGIALWLTGLGLLEIQYSFWKPDPEYLEGFYRLFEQLRPRSAADYFLSVIAIALGPAFFEESLCRGLILPSFARFSRLTTAVVASAIVFSLLHFDPYRWLFTFTVGIGFGALRLRAGSTWAAILAHAMLNALTYSVALAVEDPGTTFMPAQVPVAIGCLVFGSLASYWTIRRIGPPVRR